MGGEPVGRMTWVYDGEKFVDGVYEVACAACKEMVFAADVCPRCHAPGGLARALATPNRWPVPAACPSCDDEQLRYVAFVPARVVYEGKRAEKARSSTELHEDGFHGYRADCRDCGTVAELTDACPLCDAPARCARVPADAGRRYGLGVAVIGLGRVCGCLRLWCASASSIECDCRRSASCFAISASRP